MACCGTQQSTTAPLPQARKKWQLQPHLICERLHLLLQRRYLRLLPLHAVGELQAAAGWGSRGWGRLCEHNQLLLGRG